MKKLKDKIKMLKNKILEKKEVFVIMLVALISLFPLYYPGFIYTHDGIIHLFRTQGVYENIVNFDAFNRIYYNMANGIGYGWGIFYPPLSAIIPALFMCCGFSLFTAEKLFIIVSSIFAGIFAYKFFMELYENKFCAMLVAILYILSPYKMNQALIRGAMGEVLVFTFLPLVFLGLTKILNNQGKYKYYFVIGMTGIIYSHVISIIYTTIFGVLFLILNYKKLFKKKVIIDLILSSAIIIILSLPIIVPMLQHQTSNNYIISGIKTDVRDRVVHPGQLIGSSFESKDVENTSYYSNEKEMNYMIGLPFIVILLVLPFMYKKIKENNGIKNIVVYGLLLIISIFMMVFPGIWNRLTILDTIQYPWRILLYSVLFISVISGYVIEQLLKKENMYTIFIVIVSYSLLFAFMIGINVKFAKTLSSEFDFANQKLSQDADYGTLSFSLGYAHEYLPNSMTTETIVKKENRVDVISGDAEIIESHREKNEISININNNEENTKVELPIIYYEGYDIIEKDKDGRQNKLKYQMSESGFILINLEKVGTYSISAKYKGTTLYKICDVIAISVFISYCIYIILKKYKEK